MNLKRQILLSCEHGGANVPPRYRPLFEKQKTVLKTHRALDMGAVDIARDLQRILNAPLLYSVVSRLIVDLNRTLKSRTLLSEFTRKLSLEKRNIILDQIYFPYRRKFIERVRKELLKSKTVVHVGIHSFTPVWNGRSRDVDLAVLFDPKIRREREFAQLWLQELKREFPQLRIGRNRPYRGSADGLTKDMRKVFGSTKYLGLEIEMNQKIVGHFNSVRARQEFSKKIARSLVAIRHR